MDRRWGLGPVFALEWLTTTRRWQVYAGRMLFVGCLLVAFACVWAAQVAGKPAATIHEQAAIGQSFFRAIVTTQFILIMVVAPAATAGSICQDKERGNLLHLLLTDLSNAEIVLGKLAGRLIPLLGMVGCILPVLAMGTLLGGIDPWALAGAMAIGVAMAILCGSIAMAFSTWGTKTYEVVLATMGVEAVWQLATPIWWFLAGMWGISRPPRWAMAIQPFDLAMGPYFRPGEVDWLDFIAFCGGALAISTGLIGLAVARMRAVALAGLDEPGRPRSAASDADRTDRLDRDPAGWYERHRRRLTPWMRGMLRAFFAFAIGFGLLAVVDGLWKNPTGPYGWLAAYVVAFQVAFGLPLILLAAATATVEERARGSLDVLLATPIPTRRIVLAKWWAAFRHVGLLLPIPVLVVLPLAWDSGRWGIAALVPLSIVAWGASTASVGLALSTWVARPSRAVTAAISLYTTLAVGWPVLTIALFGTYSPSGIAFSTVSPFYGGFFLCVRTAEPRWLDLWIVDGACLSWAAAHAATAGALLLATLATFDRALGRVPERPRRLTPGGRGPIDR